MKEIKKFLLMLIVVAVPLASCSNSDKDDDDDKTTQTLAEEVEGKYSTTYTITGVVLESDDEEEQGDGTITGEMEVTLTGTGEKQVTIALGKFEVSDELAIEFPSITAVTLTGVTKQVGFAVENKELSMKNTVDGTTFDAKATITGTVKSKAYLVLDISLTTNYELLADETVKINIKGTKVEEEDEK